MDKRMNQDFKKGLENKRIVRFEEGKNLVSSEITAAKEDLAEALDRFQKEKYKYATITAYYSMFHSARALLYSQGYREKSHYYLLVAIRALFVEKGLMKESLLSEFHEAMVLRENADYNSQFSKEGADAAIKTAKEMLLLAEDLLKTR
jgi:uncharacterized protein (UPF0332 family)